MAWLGIVTLIAISAYHFGTSAHRSRSRGIADFPIFLNEAGAFLDTGILYPHTDRLEIYHPSAPVYKFPPLFATCLLPFTRSDPFVIFLYHWLLQIAVFLVASTLLAWVLRPRGDPTFLVLALLCALNLEPFFETLWRQQLETYLLLLIALALLALRRKNDTMAGAAIGVAAMLKVYPAFLLLYFVASRRWAALLGAAAAGVLVSAGTLMVVGPSEHAAYFFKILPHLLSELPVHSAENVAVARQLLLAGANPAGAKWIAQILIAPLVLVSVWAVHRLRCSPLEPSTQAVAFLIFVPLSLLWMPNSWGNYQMLLLPTLLALLAVSRERAGSPRTFLLIMLGAGLAILWVYIPCPRAKIAVWPCAETPFFLGLIQFPRGLHDGLARLRFAPALLLWLGCAEVLRKRLVPE